MSHGLWFRRDATFAAAAVALLMIGSATVSTQSSPTPGTSARSATLASSTRVAHLRDGTGYWLVSSVGRGFTVGTAQNYGSMAGKRLNAPITGIVATADGHGDWLVRKDGGRVSFGNPRFP